MKSSPGSRQDDEPRQDPPTKPAPGNPEPGNPKPPTDEEVRNIVGGLFRFAGMDRHDEELPEAPGDSLEQELVAR